MRFIGDLGGGGVFVIRFAFFVSDAWWWSRGPPRPLRYLRNEENSAGDQSSIGRVSGDIGLGDGAVVAEDLKG